MDANALNTITPNSYAWATCATPASASAARTSSESTACNEVKDIRHAAVLRLQAYLSSSPMEYSEFTKDYRSGTPCADSSSRRISSLVGSVINSVGPFPEVTATEGGGLKQSEAENSPKDLRLTAVSGLLQRLSVTKRVVSVSGADVPSSFSTHCTASSSLPLLVSLAGNSSCPIGARCHHVSDWKRLRGKKGFAYYHCEACLLRWRIPSRNQPQLAHLMRPEGSSVGGGNSSRSSATGSARRISATTSAPSAITAFSDAVFSHLPASNWGFPLSISSPPLGSLSDLAASMLQTSSDAYARISRRNTMNPFSVELAAPESSALGASATAALPLYNTPVAYNSGFRNSQTTRTDSTTTTRKAQSSFLPPSASHPAFSNPSGEGSPYKGNSSGADFAVDGFFPVAPPVMVSPAMVTTVTTNTTSPTALESPLITGGGATESVCSGSQEFFFQSSQLSSSPGSESIWKFAMPIVSTA